MTTKELAELLNGKTEDEICSKSIEKTAKENGLIYVFGQSDDIMSFRGVLHDEGNCCDGGEVLFTKECVLQNQGECEEAIETLKENGFDISSLKRSINSIEAIWCPKNSEYEYLLWAYKTDIAHEKFNLMEDDEVYCIGIVFSISDLK